MKKYKYIIGIDGGLVEPIHEETIEIEAENELQADIMAEKEASELVGNYVSSYIERQDNR